MNLCREHDSHKMILIMPTFIIDFRPANQIYTFCKGPAHVVENCPYRSSQVSIFVIKPSFDTTQPTISISSHIPVTRVLAILERNSYFIGAPSYFVTQMLSD
jgi:hypothetical protein